MLLKKNLLIVIMMIYYLNILTLRKRISFLFKNFIKMSF